MIGAIKILTYQEKLFSLNPLNKVTYIQLCAGLRMEWMQNSHVVTILGYIFQWRYCVHIAIFVRLTTRLCFKMDNMAKVRINCNGTNIQKLQYFDFFQNL